MHVTNLVKMRTFVLHSVSSSRLRRMFHAVSRTFPAAIKVDLLHGRARPHLFRGISTLTTRLESAEISEFSGKPTLKVFWDDRSINHFPFVYLRDNCQCSECFESSAQQRLWHVSSVRDLQLTATTVNFSSSRQNVTVTWPDGHLSEFKVQWLKERKFPENDAEQLKNSQSFFPTKAPWELNDGFKPMEVDYQSIIDNDATRYQWLKELGMRGLTLIKNAPTEPGQLEKIAEKVGGFIRQTHYGSVFKVMTKPNPSNIAYSGHSTPLHVDLAYYNYQPCVQLLHCIEQTADPEGGGNFFVDGFAIADYFRKQHPEVFNVLTTMKVTFRDVGRDEYGEFEKKLERPVIEVDKHGLYSNIAHNNFTRSSFLNLQLPDLLKFYEAYLTWTEEISKEENQVRHKLKPGEIWAFDNVRILHAREKYDTSISARYVEGIYLDWDEVYSTIRTLRRRLGIAKDDRNSFE